MGACLRVPERYTLLGNTRFELTLWGALVLAGVCVSLMWNLEIYPTLIVGFHGGWYVQVGERDLRRFLFVQDPKCLSNDGVVLNFLGMFVAVHQYGQ